jgi:hypothetical protein
MSLLDGTISVSPETTTDTIETRTGTPADAVEQAVTRFLGPPGMGWATASSISRAIARPRRDVEGALVRMGVRGTVERGVELAHGQVTVSWRFKHRRGDR